MYMLKMCFFLAIMVFIVYSSLVPSYEMIASVCVQISIMGGSRWIAAGYVQFDCTYWNGLQIARLHKY